MTSTYADNLKRLDIDFDFDAWKELAENDPAGFEKARQEMLQATIAAAPEKRQRRLRGLLWQLNIHRSRASNPMAACLISYQQMWDKVYGAGGLQDLLINGQPDARPESLAPVLAMEPGND